MNCLIIYKVCKGTEMIHRFDSNELLYNYSKKLWSRLRDRQIKLLLPYITYTVNSCGLWIPKYLLYHFGTFSWCFFLFMYYSVVLNNRAGTIIIIRIFQPGTMLIRGGTIIQFSDFPRKYIESLSFD